MAASIDAFLVQNVKAAENIKFELERFGAPFELRPITQVEADEIRKACTRRIRDKQTGQINISLDTAAYSNGLVKASVVTPDLNNADLQAAYGMPGKPLETLQAMLLAGEFADLAAKVQEISGFETESELVDDVKN